MQEISEKGCRVACEGATVHKDEDGGKFMLKGFMGPGGLGRALAEAKASIRESAKMGFGLS
jgi:hypothetical protein